MNAYSWARLLRVLLKPNGIPVEPAVVKGCLSRGGTATALETGRGWTPGRMVIIEFPDMDALRAWYDDPDYAPVLAIRLGAAKSTLIALDSGTA